MRFLCVFIFILFYSILFFTILFYSLLKKVRFFLHFERFFRLVCTFFWSFCILFLSKIARFKPTTDHITLNVNALCIIKMI